MVSGEPAPADQRPATETERKATQSLRVLRCHRKWDGIVAFPPRSRASLAEVALPPQLSSLAELERVPPSSTALPAGPRMHRSARSEPVIRGTVCANARTYGSVGALGRQRPRATRSEGTKRELPRRVCVRHIVPIPAPTGEWDQHGEAGEIRIPLG